MKITVKNLGPIVDCTIEPEHVMVLVGEQASGKSTIAKCIYFFRTVKDDILDYLLKGSESQQFINAVELTKILRNKFLQMFGTSMAMHDQMSLSCEYAEDVSITIDLRKEKSTRFADGAHRIPKYVCVQFSEAIVTALKSRQFTGDKHTLQQKLNEFFNDDHETIFIPADRSLLTTLSAQLPYLYASMDDTQRCNLDYGIRKYLETIYKIKPAFANGYYSMFSEEAVTEENPELNEWLARIDSLLCGRYVYTANEERLYLPKEQNSRKERYVKINLASTGQQEVVWILNILIFCLASHSKAYFIIECPENNLHPTAQKAITDILAFVTNHSQDMFITTHSVYVLGTLNNLIYAGNMSEDLKEQTAEIIPEDYQLKEVAAFLLKDGTMQSCLESDSPLIRNEVIDDVTNQINSDIDQMLKLEDQDGSDSEDQNEDESQDQSDNEPQA